jgi:hypothetical protein
VFPKHFVLENFSLQVKCSLKIDLRYQHNAAKLNLPFKNSKSTKKLKTLSEIYPSQDLSYGTVYSAGQSL